MIARTNTQSEIVLTFCTPSTCGEVGYGAAVNAPVILPARTLHTLDPGHSGDAVMIADGQIRSVGALDQLRVDHPEATVDDRYAEATILPVGKNFGKGGTNYTPC